MNQSSMTGTSAVSMAGNLVAVLGPTNTGKTHLAIERMLALEPILGTGPEWKVDLAELLLGNGQQPEAIELLNAAMSQLGDLRKTPAREQLRVRISDLNKVATAATTTGP